MRRLVLLFALAACGGSGGDPSPAPPTDVPPGVSPSACADGFRVMEGGAGCAPILPLAACPAGTRAQIGSTSCVPVGVTACPAGFSVQAKGWGCDTAVAPTCSGGARERFGSIDCTPVTDCNAAFPPAGATHFVKADYADADLDATHFRKVSDALAVAPAGAVIAVETGTYVDKIIPTKPVSVIGRCAEKVVFQSADGTTAGVLLQGIDGAVVKNLRLVGYSGGIALTNGKATVEGVVVDGAIAAGAGVFGAGSALTLTNVVIRGTRIQDNGNQAFGMLAQKGASLVANDVVVVGSEFSNVGASGAGVSLKITRSIIRDGRPASTGMYKGAFGTGIYHTDGASLTLEESLVADNVANGIIVTQGGGTPSSATIKRSVVRGTKYDLVREFARGIEVSHTSTAVIEQTTVIGSAETDVFATELSAKLDIHDSTIIGTDKPAVAASGGLGASDTAHVTARSIAIVDSAEVGAQTQAGGSLELTDSLVIGSARLGTNARDGSPMKITRSTIDGARSVGVLASSGSPVSFDGVLVTRTVGASDDGRGASVQDGAKLDMFASAIVDNAKAGIVVVDGKASLTMRGSTVGPTKRDADGQFGHGVILVGGVSATIASSTITSSAAVGLLASGSGATITGSYLSSNAIALHAQDGSSIVEGDAADDPLAVYVSTDTQLVANQARVGSGQVPLPGAVVAPK